MSYRPQGIPPEVDEVLRTFLRDELNRVSEAFTGVVEGQHNVLNAAPAKPRQGMVVYADGTNWNPGSGEGLYRFNGSSWVFIG